MMKTRHLALYGALLMLVACLASLMPAGAGEFAAALGPSVRVQGTSYTAAAKPGNVFTAVQLVPVQADTVVSSMAFVQIRLSMDGANWVHYTTMKDTVLLGVGSALWYAEIPPAPYVRFTATTLENDSIQVRPLLLEAKN